MPGTKLRLLVSDQALLEVTPLVLCMQAYQPKRHNKK